MEPYTGTQSFPPTEPLFDFDIKYGGVEPVLLSQQARRDNAEIGVSNSYLYAILESSLNGPGTYHVEVTPRGSFTKFNSFGVCVSQVVYVEQKIPEGYDLASTLNETSTSENLGSDTFDETRTRYDQNTSTLEANSIIVATSGSSYSGEGFYVTTDFAGENCNPPTTLRYSAPGIWQLGGNDRKFFAPAGVGAQEGKAAIFHIDNDFASWNKRFYVDRITNGAITVASARWNRAGVIDGALTQPAGSLVTASASASELTTSHTLAAGSNRMVVAFITAENASGNGIPDLSALQYGGVPMTQVVSLSGEGTLRGDYYHKCYAILEEDFPIGTTHTVSTVHLAGSAAGIRIQIQQYNDVVQAVPTGADVTATLFTGTGVKTITVDRHLPGDAVLFAGATSVDDAGGVGQVTSVVHDGPSRKLSTQFNDGGPALGLHTHYFTALHGGPADFNMEAHNSEQIALIGVRLNGAGKATTTEIDVTPYTQGIQVDQDAPMGSPSQSRATIRLDNSNGDFTPLLGNAFSSTDWFSYGLFIEATVSGYPTSVVFHGIIRDFKISDDSTNSYVDVLALDALSLAARGPVADFPTGFTGSTEAVIEGLLSTTFTPVDDGVVLPDLGMSGGAQFQLQEKPIYPHTVKAEGSDLSLRGSARTILDNHVLPAGPMMLFSTRILPSGTVARYEGQLVGPILVKTQGSRIIHTFTDDTTDTTKLYFSHLTFDFLTSDIINRCKANRISPLAVEKGAQTRTSIVKYGVRSKNFPQLAANTNSDVFSVAALWASRFSDPKFSILEVDLGYANSNIALTGSPQQKSQLSSLLDVRSSLWTQADIITSSLSGTPEVTTTPTSPLTTIDTFQQSTIRLAALVARLDPVISSRSVTGHGINATHFVDDAGASPLDYSFTHTLVWGYNRMILIAVMGDTTGTPDDVVTYGGVTATFLAQQLDPGSNQFVRWHYIQEVSLPSATSTDPQSYTVVVSRTNDGPQRCWVGAFEQVSQVNPPTAGGGSLTSPATTASIATVPAASLTVAAGSSKVSAGSTVTSHFEHPTYQSDTHIGSAVVIEPATASSVLALGTDSTADGGTNTSFSYSHTLTAGSNRIAICAIVGRAPAGTYAQETVTYGGVTMSFLHDYYVARGGGDLATVRFFYLLEANLPSDGANTVSITGASTSGKESWLGVFSGATQSAPTDLTDFGSYNAAGGINTIDSAPITPPLKSNIVLASVLVTNTNAVAMTHYSGTFAETLSWRMNLGIRNNKQVVVSTLGVDSISGRKGFSAYVETGFNLNGGTTDRVLLTSIGIDSNADGQTVSIIGSLGVTEGVNTTTDSISHTLPAGNNRLVIMFVLARDNDNVDPTFTTPTYGGISGTFIDKYRVYRGDAFFWQAWYVRESDLTTGANTAQIQGLDGTNYRSFYVFAVENARQDQMNYRMAYGRFASILGTQGPVGSFGSVGGANGGLVVAFHMVATSLQPEVVNPTFDYIRPFVSPIPELTTSMPIVFSKQQVNASIFNAIAAVNVDGSSLDLVTFADAVGSEDILEASQYADDVSAGGKLSTAIGNYAVAPSYDTPVQYEPNGIGQPTRLLVTGRQVRVNHKWFGIKLKTRPEYYAGFILDEDKLNSSDTI
jgi:hypothetical protein